MEDFTRLTVRFAIYRTCIYGKALGRYTRLLVTIIRPNAEPLGLLARRGVGPSYTPSSSISRGLVPKLEVMLGIYTLVNWNRIITD